MVYDTLKGEMEIEFMKGRDDGSTDGSTRKRRKKIRREGRSIRQLDFENGIFGEVQFLRGYVWLSTAKVRSFPVASGIMRNTPAKNKDIHVYGIYP